MIYLTTVFTMSVYFAKCFVFCLHWGVYYTLMYTIGNLFSSPVLIQSLSFWRSSFLFLGHTWAFGCTQFDASTPFASLWDKVPPHLVFRHRYQGITLLRNNFKIRRLTDSRAKRVGLVPVQILWQLTIIWTHQNAVKAYCNLFASA